MLKRTYAFGLLAAATLGCFSAAHASQVEVNKQTASQNAAAVGHAMLFPRPDQVGQNQLDYPGYYHPQPATPQLQISNQDAKQNGAAGTGNTVFQDLDQHNIQKQFGF